MKPTLANEAEHDRTPHFRRFQNIERQSTASLEATVERLGAAIVVVETGSTTRAKPLREALADVESELVRRLIDSGRQVDPSPSGDVVRISHRSGGSGYALGAAGAS